MRQRLCLTDDRHIQFLAHPRKAMVLECFLGRDSTISEAVAFKEHRYSRPRLVYWVKQLLAAGLIEQVGERPEGRRTVPVYRCVAEELIVSGAVALRLATQPEGLPGVRRMMFEWLQTTTRLHLERLGDDFVLKHYRVDERFVMTEQLTSWELEDRPPRMEFAYEDEWMRLRLPRKVAITFIRELEDISARIQAAAVEATEDAHPFYIGHLALVEDLD